MTQKKGGLQLDEEQSLPTELLQESSIAWYVLEYYHKASYSYVSFLLNSQVSESQSRKSPVVDITQPFLTWCWGWGSAQAFSSRLQVGPIFRAQLSEYSKGPKAACRPRTQQRLDRLPLPTSSWISPEAAWPTPSTQRHFPQQQASPCLFCLYQDIKSTLTTLVTATLARKGSAVHSGTP